MNPLTRDELRRRRRARPLLAAFVGFAAANALERVRGLHVHPGAVRFGDELVRAELERLADAGAFLYFGITDGWELHAARLSCEVRTLTAKTCPTCRFLPHVFRSPLPDWHCGHATVDAYTIADEIMSGQTRLGWKVGREVTAADLVL